MKRYYLLFLVFLLMGFVFYAYYIVFISSAVDVEEKKIVYVYPGQDYSSIRDTLIKKCHLKHVQIFDLVAKYKKFSARIKVGRYAIRNGMSINELINMFVSGNQEPFQFTIPIFRTNEDLVAKIGHKFLFGKDSLLLMLRNDTFCTRLGFTTENIRVIFLPFTYEFYWTISVKAFFERLRKEFFQFWNQERTNKAKAIGLSPVEVMILASIVDAETSQTDEMAKIAGVYINRLHKGMKLEADPTVVYAWGDFSMKRVLKRHLEINSPYNTYLNYGLPPGPIRQPSFSAIEAVLNYEKHDYLFFCAREDFSGYHRFARTAAEHAVNARKYQQALKQVLKKK
ncbi:MAG: endolytic transglycosylase MltG [Bacteroidales bacterium]|nr:endolytic transglycosylase MltG [Bacteroidales bacterium]